MGASAVRCRRLAMVLFPLVLMCGVGVASARASRPLKTVTYHGYVVTVPRSWPVFHLARDSRACVRFNRHAVYLGVPGAQENCPAHAAGRAGAILIEPTGASAARSGAAATTPAPEGSATRFAVPSAGVEVTATWSQDRSTIVRALGRRTLPAPPRAAPRVGARAASAQAKAAQATYTGQGFDACSAPSPHAMSAWGSSPYRALGIYIGGANSACAQPNLTSSWVSSEVAAGWHLIPTYVGLQAPSNSCGCAGISSGQASAQGTAAANDAVAQAQNLGLPPGNPIYDDMESYPRGGSNSSAVLAFLSAWTSGLHAKGYRSGVYSSAGAGITDLVNAYGTGYQEPDDIWIADWNGSQTTSDPYVPAGDWANHQRLHQYQGGHNETYGGVTINIDNDYLDGATADTGGAGTAQAPPQVFPPKLSVSTTAGGATALSASWPSGSGLTAWRVLAGASAAALTQVAASAAHGQQAAFSVQSAARYFAVQALGSTGQVLASSSTVATPARIMLFGHSAFVNLATGVGGIPAGCYTASTCHVATTLTVGRTTIARTGPESIPSASTGLVFFTLTPAGRMLLARARGARLPVQVSTRDAGGTAASAALTLIPFITTGRGPARTVSQSALVRVVGVTDFVFARGSGGILAGCPTAAPCRIQATLSVGRTTIATTRPELVGGSELGYVFFSLTSEGRALLTAAQGNQLGARLSLTSGGGTATARIALVQFN